MSRAHALLAALLVTACGAPAGKEPEPRARGGALEAAITLVDITEEAGIRFTHQNHRTARKLLPETMGSGLAFLDHDGDGRPDLYLANGAPLDAPAGKAAPGALYRNVDGRRFEDVTAAAGLTEPFPAMGIAVGDYDNDGHTDLFVGGVGGDRLYRNLGGRFTDVSREAGLAHPGFSSSAAFLDYDRDGDLDLFVGRYVQWSAAADIACIPDGENRMYCTPERYRGEPSRLYRNRDGRSFEDVTEAAGLHQPEGKTLGVAVIDHDRDGWPDLAVANDTERNYLFVNRKDGTFREVGVEAELAYGESGAPRGGMGIDAADADGDGLEDVVIGNFAFEMAGYYRGRPGGRFSDDAAQAGIGIPTLPTVAFGTLLADLDLDGWLDLVIANGHIEPDIQQSRPQQTYAQLLQAFRNDGKGSFHLLPATGALAEPLVGRGLAAADIDGDGDLDLAVSANGGRARLLRNDSRTASWLRLKPVGRRSNRTGYGVTATVALPGGRSGRWTLRSGSSYLSASEPVLTLGLGSLARVDRLELAWPSGATQVLEDVAVNQLLVVEEPDAGPPLP